MGERRKNCPTYIRYGGEKKKTIIPISDMGVRRKNCPTYIRYGSKKKKTILPISDMRVRRKICPTRNGSFSYLYQIWEFVLPISDMGVCVGRLGQ